MKEIGDRPESRFYRHKYVLYSFILVIYGSLKHSINIVLHHLYVNNMKDCFVYYSCYTASFPCLICTLIDSSSDDNLLKNIELFDRLSLRFSRRVLFIKDVIGSNEICLWSFYGHGKMLTEVCCTSIVYATDRKHTKVCHSIVVIILLYRLFS